MLNQSLKDRIVSHVLPKVQTPAQYVGGELNMVRRTIARSAGRLCMAFPDMYTIGMSHHGLQVLYTLMNARDDWVCERAFTPWLDMERELRAARLAALQPGDVHAARGLRRAGLHAAVRNLHEQHADDARSGRHSAAKRRSGRWSIRW